MSDTLRAKAEAACMWKHCTTTDTFTDACCGKIIAALREVAQECIDIAHESRCSAKCHDQEYCEVGGVDCETVGGAVQRIRAHYGMGDA